MKRIILLGMIGLMLSSCASTKRYVTNPSLFGKIRKVVVLPFACKDTSIGEAISYALADKLVASNWIVIDRSKFLQMLREQGVSGNKVDSDLSTAIGKVNGIDGVIVGIATMDWGNASVFYPNWRNYVSSASAQILDPGTGQIIMGVTFATSAAIIFGAHTPTDIGEKLADEMTR